MKAIAFEKNIKNIMKKAFKYVNAEHEGSDDYSRTNRLVIVFDMLYSYVRYGVNPKEYHYFGFAGKPKAQRKTYFTRKMFKELCDSNTHPRYIVISQDKFICSKVFAEFYKRECVNKNELLDFQDFKDFVAISPKFIYKPYMSVQGQGIKVFELADYDDIQKLYDDIKKLPNGNLEEWIKQHPSISELYPDSVNCIRIVTVLRDGKCNFLGSTLTLGYKTKIANALSGGVFALVDVNTGVVTSDLCGYSGELYKSHPETGFVSKGYQIPFWDEILALLEKASKVIPQLAYSSWDIAISETGPVIIELNQGGGYMGYQFDSLRSDGIGTKSLWGQFIK